MTEQLHWLLVLPLSENVRALVAGSLVAVVCGVIGCFIILRGMAFLGDALSHTMLAGVTAGRVYGVIENEPRELIVLGDLRARRGGDVMRVQDFTGAAVVDDVGRERFRVRRLLRDLTHGRLTAETPCRSTMPRQPWRRAGT